MKIRPAGSASSPLVIENVRQLQRFDMSSVRPREMPTVRLMASIGGFEVKGPINHWMHGNKGKVDRKEALNQWVDLYASLSSLCPTKVVQSVEEYEDMVFIANAGLAVKINGKKIFVVSNMKCPSRYGESYHYEQYMCGQGYEIIRLPEGMFFEGHGDALWQLGKLLLWGGHGYRSDAAAYYEISRRLDVPVILLRLVSPKFYHLDTAFCPFEFLDKKYLLYCPDAFDSTSNEMIELVFPSPQRIPVTEEEASTFVCNSVPVERHIIIPEGVERVGIALEEIGLTVHWVNMREFRKSGGAAACQVFGGY